MSEALDSGAVCSIETALALVGDRWTLLIMRELSLGVRRFDGIQAHLKVSSFLLSTRLKKLEKEGVIERRLYLRRPDRYEYHATEKGLALDPLLVILRGWGMAWAKKLLSQESDVTMVYRPTGEIVDADWHGPNGQAALRLADFQVTIGDRIKGERQARVAAFRRSKKNSESSVEPRINEALEL